jgi:hypothetical protein
VENLEDRTLLSSSPVVTDAVGDVFRLVNHEIYWSRPGSSVQNELQGGPYMALAGDGRHDVFALGLDHKLYRCTTAGATVAMTGVQTLLQSYHSNGAQVLTLLDNGQLQQSDDGTHFSTIDLGGTLTQLAAGQDRAGWQVLFALRQDGVLFVDTPAGVTHPLTNVQTLIQSYHGNGAPVATVLAGGQLEQSDDGSSFQNLTSIGFPRNLTGVATVQDSAGQQVLLLLGSDGTLWRDASTGLTVAKRGVQTLIQSYHGNGAPVVTVLAGGSLQQSDNGLAFSKVDLGGTLTQLAAGYNASGQQVLYALRSDGVLFVDQPVGTSVVAAGVQCFEVAPDGSVYALRAGGELDNYSPLTGLAIVDLGVLSFTVASNGTLTVHDYLNTYGFNFPNFVINKGEPGISWGIVKGEFGGDQVDITAGIPWTSVQIDTGVPSLFGLAFWAAAANELNGGGACFGMALTSEKMAARGQNVYSLPETGALVTTIEETHLAQLSAEMLHYAASWALHIHSPLGIYNQLSTLLAGGDHPIITLGDGGNGHAVVAYGLQPGPKGDGDFYIDVCDSNAPAIFSNWSNIWVELYTRIYIDPSRGWSYAPLGWSGSGYGATSLMLVPGSVLSGSPTLPNSLSGLATIVFGSCPPSALAGVVQLNQLPTPQSGASTITMPSPSDEPAATHNPSSGDTLEARPGQLPLGVDKAGIASGMVSLSDPLAAVFGTLGCQSQDSVAFWAESSGGY